MRNSQLKSENQMNKKK